MRIINVSSSRQVRIYHGGHVAVIDFPDTKSHIVNFIHKNGAHKCVYYSDEEEAKIGITNLIDYYNHKG